MVHPAPPRPTRPDPPGPSPLYGTVRCDVDATHVVLDVTEAAVTRLVRLLAERPSLIATFALAAGAGHASHASAAPLRRAAVVELAADRGVRGACTARLSREAATDLAAALIAAAASVGTPADRGTAPSPAPGRTDPR